MEKPGSGLWLWARLKRRDKWPRRWWYPLQDRSPQKPADTTVKESYKECVLTIRRTMLVLLAFSLFCLVAVIGSHDSALVAPEAKIMLPFAEAEIAFLGFLVAAPFLLIVLTIYLHVFDTSRLELAASSKVSPPPTLFTLNRPLPNALTKFIFFWLVPFVLAAITWKAMARPLWWGLPLLFVTIVVTASLVWMQIRRCPAEQRFRNLPRWGLLIVLVCVAGIAAWDAAVWDADVFRRSLDLFRADLAHKWLVGADLRGANLHQAKMQGADLRSANLQTADLSYANLQGADLSTANLEGANLFEARLEEATLIRAKLRGADLRDAKLPGANLARAKMQGAVLRGANLKGANLFEADLQGAALSAADLQGAAELPGAALSSTNLQGTDLRGVNLQGATLYNAKLQGADLRGAKMQGAALARAKLQGADLRGAKMQGANLLKANLQAANLRGANLRGADLNGAEIWLTRAPNGQCCENASLAFLMETPSGEAVKALQTSLEHLADDGLRKHAAARLEELFNDKKRQEWKGSRDYNAWADLERQSAPDPDKASTFLAQLACDDGTKEGYLARALVGRMSCHDSAAFYQHLKACVDALSGLQVQQRPIIEFLQIAVQSCEKAGARRGDGNR